MNSASIVLYHNEQEQIKRVLHSLLRENVLNHIYLIDNSSTQTLSELKEVSNKIQYLHTGKNLGFGAAHNLAIEDSIKKNFVFHFIVNPDIFFDKPVLQPMINFIENDDDVGMVMPEVLYPDGTIQYLPKLLPSPIGILLRLFKYPPKAYTRFISKYELRFVPQNTIYSAPVLSGCFTLLSLDKIQQIGMYDDIFFMYFEDWDLSRRMHRKFKTIYFPEVAVYHEYVAGARKNSKLFRVFLFSAYRYFSKWGWFFDEERVRINMMVLKRVNF